MVRYCIKQKFCFFTVHHGPVTFQALLARANLLSPSTVAISFAVPSLPRPSSSSTWVGGLPTVNRFDSQAVTHDVLDMKNKVKFVNLLLAPAVQRIEITRCAIKPAPGGIAVLLKRFLLRGCSLDS
jgi:hypothetical protein